MELSVRGDRVLIKPEDQSETVRDSGLIAIRQYSSDTIGTVIAVGDRVEEVNPGDVVLFTQESGQVLDYGGEKLLVLYEDELLAVWYGDNEPI